MQVAPDNLQRPPPAARGISCILRRLLGRMGTVGGMPCGSACWTRQKQLEGAWVRDPLARAASSELLLNRCLTLNTVCPGHAANGWQRCPVAGRSFVRVQLLFVRGQRTQQQKAWLQKGEAGLLLGSAAPRTTWMLTAAFGVRWPPRRRERVGAQGLRAAPRQWPAGVMAGLLS